MRFYQRSPISRLFSQCVFNQEGHKKWWWCIGFTYLNKASSTQSFPLLIINKLVDSNTGHQLLSFLDAFPNQSGKVGWEKNLFHYISVPIVIKLYHLSWRMQNQLSIDNKIRCSTNILWKIFKHLLMACSWRVKKWSSMWQILKKKIPKFLEI